MGFAHPALNNIGTHKAKKSKRLLEVEREHREFLLRMGVPMGRKVRQPKPTNVPEYSRTTPNYPSLMSREASYAAKKEEKIYMGERVLLGIATMHKSNMVPVFADKKEDATEIARMRR